MSRTSRAELQRRSTLLLKYIAGRIDRRVGYACVPYCEMSRALNVSENCVRFSLRKLEDEGMVTKRSRYLPNGGQLENAYSITERGIHALMPREEGANGNVREEALRG